MASAYSEHTVNPQSRPNRQADPQRPPAGWNIHAGDGSDEDEDPVDEFRQTKESIYWCIEATPTMLAPMLAPPSGDNSSLKPGATPTPTLSSSTQRPPTTTQTQTQAQTKEIAWKGAPAKSKLEECLRCVYAMMKRKVISSPKDLLGVLIWNTVRFLFSLLVLCHALPQCVDAIHCSQEATVKSTSDHCHLLVELKQIDAQMIKDMRTLLQRAWPLSSETFVARTYNRLTDLLY
jgi:ATP-dependent DNA helicase 2 subunit 1